MPKTIFIATDPSGKLHTRSSENRTYTHTVVAQRSFGFELAHADEIRTSDLKHFDYQQQIASGNDPYPTINHIAQYPQRWTPEQIAEGQRHTDEANAKRLAEAQALVTTHGDRDNYAANMRAERLHAIHREEHDGKFDVWHNLGWCGRHDLAAKLFNRVNGGGYWTAPHILVATVQQKKVAA